MIATVENMKRCEGIHGVFMLDSEGNEFSASPGDYFLHRSGEPILDEHNEPMILVRRVCQLVDPLSGEPI
jgi:hypothetical protein